MQVCGITIQITSPFPFYIFFFFFLPSFTVRNPLNFTFKSLSSPESRYPLHQITTWNSAYQHVIYSAAIFLYIYTYECGPVYLLFISLTCNYFLRPVVSTTNYSRRGVYNLLISTFAFGSISLREFKDLCTHESLKALIFSVTQKTS